MVPAADVLLVVGTSLQVYPAAGRLLDGRFKLGGPGTWSGAAPCRPTSREAGCGCSWKPCRQRGHRWKPEYGGLRTPQAKRLKDLETEHARLVRHRDDVPGLSFTGARPAFDDGRVRGRSR
jgi:hypothetical protein